MGPGVRTWSYLFQRRQGWEGSSEEASSSAQDAKLPIVKSELKQTLWPYTKTPRTQFYRFLKE